MKRLLALALALLTTATLAADTPEAILKDYRAKAEAALAKTNKVLETEAATLGASLLRSGATAEAEALTTQVKQKIAGEPLPSPAPVAANLFKQYDTARAAALKPIQAQFIARIDALTHTSAGQQVDTVAQLAKIKAEIESDRTPAKLPDVEEWTYHMTANAKPNGKLSLKSDGTLQLVVNGKTETGTWLRSKKNLYKMVIGSESFETEIDKDTAVMKRPIGNRYLKRASLSQP